jgi:ubiquitin carboxyl-terminal hydrolase 8
MANDMESTLDRSPKDWFERARYEVDKAVLAERKGNEEEMFVTYTRVCQCYVHCKGHPGLPEQKRKDPAWSVRFKDFKEVSRNVWRWC